MNVAGIIAEYNPFHLGHAYHLAEARRLTNADFVVVVMSGDFVQRGEPALMDKYLRTQMALMNGADLVLELPVPFATAGSKDFAGGAVAILDKLGVVNSLVFGSESGNLEDIQTVAKLLENETVEASELIRQALKEGHSYPSAVAKAVLTAQINRDISSLTSKNDPLAQILSSPNNLLGVEYCRALKRRSSSIQPFTIKRLGNYHGNELSPSDQSEGIIPVRQQTALHFASASALRQAFSEHPLSEALELIRDNIPESTYSLFQTEAGHSLPLFADDFTDALFYRLLNETEESLCHYLDVSPDLAGRILKLLPSCRSVSELAETVKCKAYTRLRINRGLFHCLLGITDEEMSAFKQNDYAGFARVLGFKEEAAPLLREISAHASIPLLLRMKEDKKKLNATDLRLLDRNDLAANLYRMTVQRKFGISLPEEYSRKLLRV